MSSKVIPGKRKSIKLGAPKPPEPQIGNKDPLDDLDIPDDLEPYSPIEFEPETPATPTNTSTNVGLKKEGILSDFFDVIYPIQSVTAFPNMMNLAAVDKILKTHYSEEMSFRIKKLLLKKWTELDEASAHQHQIIGFDSWRLNALTLKYDQCFKVKFGTKVSNFGWNDSYVKGLLDSDPRKTPLVKAVIGIETSLGGILEDAIDNPFNFAEDPTDITRSIVVVKKLSINGVEYLNKPLDQSILVALLELIPNLAKTDSLRTKFTSLWAIKEPGSSYHKLLTIDNTKSTDEDTFEKYLNKKTWLLLFETAAQFGFIPTTFSFSLYNWNLFFIEFEAETGIGIGPASGGILTNAMVEFKDQNDLFTICVDCVKGFRDFVVDLNKETNKLLTGSTNKLSELIDVTEPTTSEKGSPTSFGRWLKLQFKKILEERLKCLKLYKDNTGWVLSSDADYTKVYFQKKSTGDVWKEIDLKAPRLKIGVNEMIWLQDKRTVLLQQKLTEIATDPWFVGLGIDVKTPLDYKKIIIGLKNAPEGIAIVMDIESESMKQYQDLDLEYESTNGVELVRNILAGMMFWCMGPTTSINRHKYTKSSVVLDGKIMYLPKLSAEDVLVTLVHPRGMFAYIDPTSLDNFRPWIRLTTLTKPIAIGFNTNKKSKHKRSNDFLYWASTDLSPVVIPTKIASAYTGGVK